MIIFRINYKNIRTNAWKSWNPCSTILDIKTRFNLHSPKQCPMLSNYSQFGSKLERIICTHSPGMGVKYKIVSTAATIPSTIDSRNTKLSAAYIFVSFVSSLLKTISQYQALYIRGNMQNFLLRTVFHRTERMPAFFQGGTIYTTSPSRTIRSSRSSFH